MLEEVKITNANLKMETDHSIEQKTKKLKDLT
jgi:hypothetical protein